jgi:hypothetical protein
MTEELHIGWCETDITPEGVVELCGQYYQRLSEGVHSRLKAVAWVLHQGETVFVMLGLDTALVSDDLQDALRERVRGQLPFDPACIVLAATHTHCAPAFIKIRQRWANEPGIVAADTYCGFLLARLEEAVLGAWRSRRLSGIAHGAGQASIGHCRRVVYTDGTCDMYGATDRPDFAGLESGEDAAFDLVLCVDDVGRPTGAVVVVPCPAQVMEATRQISADYVGRLRECLQERFGADFRTLCLIAPAGDQSPRDLTRPHSTATYWRSEGAELIATRLARAIEALVPDLADSVDYRPPLSHRCRAITLPRRRASAADAQAATAALDRLRTTQSEDDAFADFCAEALANEQVPNRPGPYDNKACQFVEIRNNEAVVARYADQDRQPTYGMELHVLRLGDIVFATNPFELFLELGQRIRGRSPVAATVLVQLCGDYGGYLPTARAEELGGYGALIINGQVGAEGGAMLVEATLAAIGGLCAEAAEQG